MAIRERPRLDRAKQCRADEQRRRTEAFVRQVLSLLGPGEAFASPHRDGGAVVLPIVPAPEAVALHEEPA